MVRVRVWLLAGLECVALVNQLTYQGLAGARVRARARVRVRVRVRVS